jgi:hypothetical protein
VQEKYRQPFSEFVSSVLWKHSEHINVADRFATETPIPSTRRANRDIFMNGEAESIRIEIRLVNNVSVRIFGGSALVYEGFVHYSCPIGFVPTLISSDMITIRTPKPRQILQVIPSHFELIFHHILT